MKTKIIAILLVGLLASCTKEKTVEPVKITVEGDWYDNTDKSKAIIVETFNIQDSTYKLVELKGNFRLSYRFYLLPFNRMVLNGRTYKYEVNETTMMYGSSIMYR